ncbi:lipopolysaccharide-induced tumor necrosis factor-alpha factor homolog isoform X2 [Drosophila montana]|uniref:lipopolysaccharide-induced tumor necrosis factor-alpha factor homolog isoform X2 n=1 Tax=Drosophila montana TaxID=40370 RepID=UPI00313E0F16
MRRRSHSRPATSRQRTFTCQHLLRWSSYNPPPAVGPDPCYISCPHCHVQKLTRVEYSPSVRTHCMAALLCIVGLWCFACLPYCATSCMNANHFCGNCNKFVGVYSSD